LREELRPREFETWVLRRTYWPTRDGVTGELRKRHNEELNEMYSSPNNIRVIKSGIMYWAGHVARIGERTGAFRFWWGNLRETDHFGHSGVDGMIILNGSSETGM